MYTFSLAQTYAVALFETCTTKKAFREAVHTLEQFANYWQGQEVKRFFSNPRVGFDTKMSLLEDIFENKPHQAMNLLALLLQKKRLTLVPLIAQRMKWLQEKKENITSLEIRSSHSLTKNEKSKILKHFENIYPASTLEATWKVDSSVLAGFTAIVNHHLFLDYSLDSRLKTFRKYVLSNDAPLH